MIDRVARQHGPSAVKQTTGTGGGFKRFCALSPAIQALPEATRARVCTSLRSDGRFIAAGEDVQAIVAAPRRTPGS